MPDPKPDPCDCLPRTAIHDQVDHCRAGTHPRLVARVTSGWVVMGEAQHLLGYCLLLPDPVVPHLNALTGPARAAYLADVARVGDALLTLTGALRINYGIFGNLEPALHTHIHPRYADEPDDARTLPPLSYPAPPCTGPSDDPPHGPLRLALAEGLQR